MFPGIIPDPVLYIGNEERPIVANFNKKLYVY